jgi:transposase
MTVTGVGAITALAFRTAVDDPERFRNSAAVGAYFGLTPSKYASGEANITGQITKSGDKAVRALLCEAANALLARVSRWGWAKGCRASIRALVHYSAASSKGSDAARAEAS